MRRRISIVPAIALLVSSSCTDDDSTTSSGRSSAVTSTSSATSTATTDPGSVTTSSPMTTPVTSPTIGATATPSSTTASTVFSSTGGVPAAENVDGCLYRDDIILVRGDTTEGVPGFDDIDRLDTLADFAEFGLSVDDIGRLLRLVGPGGSLTALRIDEGDDPLQRANILEETTALEASPVLLITIGGHWKFAPGSPPTDGLAGPEKEFPGVDPAATVAVVDTGYEETAATPSWLADRVAALHELVPSDKPWGDAEPPRAQQSIFGVRSVPPDVEGHGKFVASVIAQQEPGDEVVVAGISNLTDENFEGEPSRQMPEVANGISSDELQLYVAIERFVDSRRNYDALNLSLGTYQCPDLDDSGFALRGALQRWRRAYRAAPVVAAAGNHEVGHIPPTDFIPAVRANGKNSYDIASVDSADQLSAFSNDADYAANGEDSIGVRRDGEWAMWSGTSFAAPVVSARIARDPDALRAARSANGRGIIDR